MQYYHNSSFLENGGTPQDFIKNGFTYSIDKYITEKNMYKSKEKKITFEDIQDSLIIISDTYSTISLYTDQAKKKIKSKFMQSHVTDFIKEQLYIYFVENSNVADRICNQILINKRAREKSEDTKKNIKKKLSEKITIINKIPNLYESESEDPNETILCICEGKSALSSLLVGKRNIHAIFPLRGKILNCLKASPEQIFSNEVIKNLILAMGCGVEFKSSKNKDLSNFNINNLRYSKVYIFVDADVDGIGSIMPLLLTMFYTLTPTLVKQERICICESPKYEIDFGDEEYFAVNDEDLERVKQQLNYEQNKNKIKIHYIKGLSELSSNAMSMCLAEDYKNVRVITLDEIEKSAETIELFMSTEVKPRKEYILDNFESIGGNLE
jgi:DNA gyrase subunit B